MKSLPDIDEAAAAWFAMLRRGPMSLEERARFDQWRVDPRHQAALSRMHELWGETSALKTSGMVIDRPQSRRVPVALAAALVLAIGGGLIWNTAFRPLKLTTGIGEQRSQTLSDGSVVALNVVSRVRYDSRATARQVFLDEGEAIFIVKKDQDRPFSVMAGDYEVRAIGTAFNVLSRDARIEVSVKEGLVEVRSRKGAGRPVLLRAGQNLILKGAEPLNPAKAQPIDTRAVAEWRQRVLSYEDVPITTVVADINRFFERRLEVSPKLASSRVTIRLVVDDRADTLARLSGILDAKVMSAEKSDHLVAPMG